LLAAGRRRHDRPVQRPDECLTEGTAELRRWRASEDTARTLAQAVTESLPELRPWMPWATPGYGVAEAREYLASCEQNWESGQEWNYAILADGELAGGTGLMPRIGPGGLEIGYWVHSAYRRQGLATAASAALCRAAFGLPGIDRVEIHHDVRNVASGGIPRKLGFTEVGTQPGPEPGVTDLVWRLDRAAARASGPAASPAR
jgi:RimJ/RimL family protein N-acetyltransferase